VLCRHAVIVTAVVAALALTACSTDDTDDSVATPTTATSATSTPRTCTGTVTRDIEYVERDHHGPGSTRLDVYPASDRCDAPAILWVHGGGWVRGSKDNDVADKVAWANANGWALVAVDYRLTDPTAADPVQYPEHDDDVAAAVAFVVAHGADYGIDGSRLGLLGHSAGASIVADVGVDPTHLEAHELGLDAIGCTAAVDTAAYDLTASGGDPAAMFAAVFGPDRSTWAERSVINRITPDAGTGAVLIVERGTPARRDIAHRFASALRDAGVAVTQVDAGGLTHTQVNRQIGRADDVVVSPTLTTFFATCLDR
jgi:acetyl esterase/lipase